MKIILIPSYEPDERIIDLIKDLQIVTQAPIVVVNDGSDSTYAPIFNECEQLGAIVIHHLKNLGKGAALKTGFSYCVHHFQEIESIVTCDGDGQHLPQDINQLLLDDTDYLALGVRTFYKKTTPLKSRIGNHFSALYFKLNTGISCPDTQTGLRKIPHRLFDLALNTLGDRYEYEMNFLMSVAKEDHSIKMIPIETVYYDHNEKSHFSTIKDSIKIYQTPLRFLIVSLLSALVDLSVFTVISASLSDSILKKVLIATISARIISGLFNFLMNRFVSFKSYASILKQFRRYLILYLVQLTLSITLVTLLSFIPIHLTIIKIIVDSVLFILSYFIQKNWVYKFK